MVVCPCVRRLGLSKDGAVDIFTGTTEGKIVEKRGEGGFGFDPVFLPTGSDKTLAENKDNKYNSRFKAITALVRGEREARVPLLPSSEWKGKWQH